MIKRILRYLLFFIAALFIGAIAISFFYADKIEGIVINEINKKLNVPAGVKEINFSVIKNFPNASVAFEEVFIREINRQNPDTLLYAKKIIFLFDLFQLFGKDFSIKKIIIDNSVFKLQTDKSGNNNYEIWKKDTLQLNNQPNGFKLESVLFHNSEIQYVNDFKKVEFKTKVSEGKLKGEFTKQLYDLDVSADLMVDFFKVHGVRYIRQKQTKLAFVLAIDDARKMYSFKSSEVQLAELHFLINGSLNKEHEGLLISLHISSPGSGPQALLSLLPFKNADRIHDYNYKGAVIFDMNINGLISKTNTPRIEIKFGAENVSVTPKDGSEPLRQISFTGNYSNNKGNSGLLSYIAIKQFKAVLKGQMLEGYWEMTDFEKPYLKMSMNGTIDIALLSRFFKSDFIQEPRGMVNSHFLFEGKLGVFNTYKASGTLNINQASFSLKNNQQTFKDINGAFACNGNDIEVRELTGKTGESSFGLNGIVTNFYSYIILPDQPLSVKVRFISNELNIDDFLKKGEASPGMDSDFKTHFSDRLTAEVGVEIQHLHYKKFESNDLKGIVLLQNKVLSTSGLKFNCMEGSASVKGILNASRHDSILISAEASVKAIDITKLFYQMGNFGQDVIEDKNLKGKATAEIQFASTWSLDLVCNTNKVFTNADLVIDNGELINFEPTQGLTKYIKGVDFSNIKFSTLKNNVQIKNRTIYFSTMEIKSTAMDITTSGTHTFDNIVDYKIKLLLSQVLGKKVKEQNTEFGTIEDDGLGRTSIFLRMYGPMKNPKFTYDNKAVEDKIVNDLKVEKQNLKNVLSKEFGWFKKDSTTVIKEGNRNKKEEIQIDYDDETEEK